MNLKKLAATTLVITLGFGPATARAQDSGVVVDRGAIEQALSRKVLSDADARDSIRNLLRRDDVKALAGGLGLDVQRAEASVGTLEGRALQETAARAQAASDLLVGGVTTISISLVSLLLIIIIIILLAD